MKEANLKTVQCGRGLPILLLGLIFCYFFLFCFLIPTSLAQSPLPTPNNAHLSVLFASAQQGKSVLLARVVELAPHPQPVTQTNTSSQETYTTGRFSVLETVSGPAAAPQIDVDNTDPEAGMMFRHGAVVTGRMRLGEYWLLVYDTRIKYSGPIKPGYQAVLMNSFPLSDPRDPVLAAYRHSLLWLSNPTPQAAFEKARLTLLDTQAPLLLRLSAFLSLRQLLHSPLWTQTLTALLAQSALPSELRLEAIRSIRVDPAQTIAAGSDAALQFRYLLEGISRIGMGKKVDARTLIIDEMANCLYFINQDAENQHPPVFYPELLTVLRKRQITDKITNPDGNSWVNRTLMNLELGGGHYPKDLKHFKGIIRSVPQWPNTALAKRLQAASVQP